MIKVLLVFKKKKNLIYYQKFLDLSKKIFIFFTESESKGQYWSYLLIVCEIAFISTKFIRVRGIN